MIIDFSAFFPDSRGDPLEKYEWADSSGGSRPLLLRGPEAAANQLQLCFQARGLERQELQAGDAPDWTHRFNAPDELVPEIESVVKLFCRTLLIPCASPLYSLIALGFYKDPDSGINPMDWKNAPAGDLINRAKYRSDAKKFDELVDELVAIISEHPLYADHAEVVISVPGHKSGEVSFSETLAAAVAEKASLPLVSVTGRSDQRPQAKSETRADLDLSHEFAVAEDVSGKVVIVIDDVYMTGKTMKNVAAVLSDSGARAVLGLVGARTMKAS